MKKNDEKNQELQAEMAKWKDELEKIQEEHLEENEVLSSQIQELQR